MPTSLSTSAPSNSTPSNRTAIIAGASAGAVGLLFIALAALFLWKRHQQHRTGFLEALSRSRRENTSAGGVGLLDGEFDDDEDDDGVPMRRYRDAVPGHSAELSSSTTHSSAPSLFRARGAETGSVFREQVWPPPGEGSQFVDPFVGDVRGASAADLSKIVDDVMGPSMSAGLPPGDPRPRHASPSESLFNDPFRDQSHAGFSPSVYYDRPSPAASTSSLPGTSGLPPGAAQPKKPSPLGGSSTPPPRSSKNWLERSPRTVDRPLTPSAAGEQPGIGMAV